MPHHNQPTKRSIGLMSGTSADGIDLVDMLTDGQWKIQVLGCLSMRYPRGFHHALKALEYAAHQCQGDRAQLEHTFQQRAFDYCTTCQDAKNTWASIQVALNDDVTLHAVERLSAECHLELIQAYLKEHQISAKDIDVIGYHGQTIYHQPYDISATQPAKTLQIGDPSYLANKLGIRVVAQFRQKDIEHGGQGAPLAPFYHRAKIVNDKLPLPTAVINCGGISNITLVYGAALQETMAGDMGPGNVLIDRYVKAHTKQAMDKEGKFGQQGVVDEALMRELYQSVMPRRTDFFKATFPKSLDTNDFVLPASCTHAINTTSPAFYNVCCTLETFTAQIMVDSFALLNKPLPKLIILAGGGWRNPVIYQAFIDRFDQQYTSQTTLKIASDLDGWSGQYLEAETFAYLAVRHLSGQCFTTPLTTGVDVAQLCGGELF
jgi:anhydro-N-acetylmuramic acid kinase